MVGVTEIPPNERGGAAPLSINEIQAADEGQFWIELINDSAEPLDITGMSVLATGANGGEYVFPNSSLASGEYLVVNEDTLGFHPDDGEKLVVYSADGNSVIDARRITNRLRGRSDQFPNQWLFPEAATPGADNQFDFNSDIVINEIMYHAFPFLGKPGTPSTFETTTLLSFNHFWKYNETGDNLGTTWYRTNHNVDGNDWKQGEGPIGYETSALPEPLETNLANPRNVDVTTYYFQTEFNVSADDLDGATDIVLRPHGR